MSDASAPLAIDPAARIETVWIVEGTYAPDALELRRPFRVEHLDRLARLRQAGVVLETGGYIDGSSALTMIRAESAEAALDVMREDIYLRQGIWVELRARAFGRLRDGG